ncbi:glycosyltransferase [Nocardia sp. NBC_01499]|uniref:glycosyltransferase n=1 Tax=Nocardia sp. NBC_01499 TaxID=2903597 RepID=UPI00386FB9F4
MRVLFVATPLIGHAFPMMALALHLQSTGNDVLLATGGDAATALRTELAVESVAPAVNLARSSVRAYLVHPHAALRSLSGMADARAGARLFARINRPMSAALIALARRYRPDLVIHEPFAASGAIAAAAVGAPTVLHNIALDRGEDITCETLKVLGAKVPGSVAVLSVAPPSLVTVPGWPMRYVPYSLPAPDSVDWLRIRPTRPRILVTRSTMLGDGPDAMLTSLIRAAPQVDAEFVVVRPNRPLERAHRLPDNVRTVGWTVLSDVLPYCTGMLNHGGAGSIYAALAAGIPQIATPAPGDRGWNATLVASSRTGLAIPAKRITHQHLTTLITDPTLAANAQLIAAEIAAMPAPATVATRLAGLVGH